MTGPAKKGIRNWKNYTDLEKGTFFGPYIRIINNICKLYMHNYISLEFHLDSISKFKVSKNDAKFV